MTEGSKPVAIQQVNAGAIHSVPDIVSVEEPLEIRLLEDTGARPISVTMRTPGHDRELAVGFLFTEGIIKQNTDLLSVSQPESNIVVVELNTTLRVSQAALARNFYTTSSCGVCGKASIDAIRVNHAVIKTKIEIDSALVVGLPELARAAQTNFTETGGSHASSLFTANGRLLLTREDVGRHNALDKVIGHCLLNTITVNDLILLVSGRASFELIQKAAVAGIPLVAAIGAPSSLAIDLAIEAGITLIGFLKADRFNIYSHRNRIKA